MFFTVCPTGWEPDQVTVRRKGRLEISHLNPRSEELYSGNDIAKKEKKIPVYPKWHRPKGPPHSVCLLRERPAVSTQCACPRARTSRILFSKVFGKANQVQRYWCWDITELTLSWFAHTHTSIYMAQCKVHSCTLAQKRRFFYLKNRPSQHHCYSQDDMLHKHTPASILFPSLEGSADSSILKALRDFLYPGVPCLPPWPDTHDSHNLSSGHVIQRLQMLHSVRLSLPPTPAHGWEAI